jgi:hypothetical protein
LLPVLPDSEQASPAHLGLSELLLE